MERDVSYYLMKSPEELKNIELKNEIINNNNQYIFIWFCQRASKEQLENLLDADGINLLYTTNDLNNKINGLLTSGTKFNAFENESFCQMVLDTNMISYAYDLNERAALSFAQYVYEHDRERLIEVFSAYVADNQISLYENLSLEPEEKIMMLRSSKKETAKYLLDRTSIDLSKLSINDIEVLIQKNVTIPKKNETHEFANRVASIGDVNRYRLLINQYEENHDVSEIKDARKKVYERELASINEEGLLEKFQILKDKIKSGELSINNREQIESLEGFAGAENLMYKAMLSRNLDETIRKMNDYYLSNIIIDYYFEDVPTNLLKNIEAMMAYNKENPFLSEEDARMYDFIQKIDELDSKHKLMLFEVLKEQGIDMVSKFYDDFTNARETMVEQINNSIISEDNMEELYNEELSKRAGVPIYYLNGQEYKSLVRNIGVEKTRVLTEENLDFLSDGSSFSVDGSEKVEVFGNIKSDYTLAYSGIPKKQLVHAFFGDSFSKYDRDENDIPQNRDSAERTMGFYTPDQLVTIGDSYSELVISVPNKYKSNEFEEKLERPKAIAIYCYDEIKETDIESAKNLGLGIILVNTKAYNVDRRNRINTHDTFGKKKPQYIKNTYEKDERTDI